MKLYKICSFTAKVLVFAFIPSVCFSFATYMGGFYSAPFYLFVASDAIELLLPGGILHLLSGYLKKKDI